jgi:hypothetical protein
MALDAKEEWIKLRRRVRLSYYIGPKAVQAIEDKIMGGAGGGSTPPATLGIDVDNDGVVDATYTKKTTKKTK